MNCYLCKSIEHAIFIEMDDYRIIKCKQCGLVYSTKRIVQEEINKEYSAEYHTERLFGRELKTEKEIEQEVKKNSARAKEIVKQFGNQGKLLDIGCGRGFFIACLKKYGWDVTGVDISEWASKFAREKLGLNVFTGNVEEIQFNNQFDVITMYHNLEHLPYPIRTLKKVSELITNGGVLIIKGPNLASFDRIWHGKNWRGYTDRTHIYYFTPKTYQMTLNKAGFSVQKIIFQQWDPIAHLAEIKLGDGIRADHPADAFEDIENEKAFSSLIFKIMRIMSAVLCLKGRDLTIFVAKGKVL